MAKKQKRMMAVMVSLGIVVGLASYNWSFSGEKNVMADPYKEVDEKVELEKEAPERKENLINGRNLLEKTVFMDSEGRKVVKNPSHLLVLVNKERNLPSDYIPEGLVIPDVLFPFEEDIPKKYVRQETADALEALFGQAESEGIYLFASSGYRSYKRQKSIFDYRAETRGEEVANQTTAYPGQSEHQTGLAMDVTSRSVGFRLVEEFGQTKEGQWLKDHAHEYGFVIRYPKGKEHITGYSYEPWHLRYVGKDVAEMIISKDITFEDYYEQTDTIDLK